MDVTLRISLPAITVCLQETMDLNYINMCSIVISTPQNKAFLRVFDDWNSLPRDIVQSLNVFLFKKKLEEHWQQFCFEFL